MKNIIFLLFIVCSCAHAGVDDSYTKTLLHFNGDFVDESGKSWTALGGAIATSTSPRFGAGCAYFPGAGGYIWGPDTTDFDPGAGSFTIDWWEKITGGPNHLVFNRGNTSYSPWCFIGAGNNLFFSSSGAAWDISGGQTIGTNGGATWIHYAIVRDGSYFHTFKGGVEQASWTSGLTAMAGVGSFTIGCDQVPDYFQGYVDEMRISKGVARWIADFTPPTGEYAGLPEPPPPAGIKIGVNGIKIGVGGIIRMGY